MPEDLILVVEDDPTFSALVVRFLQALGYPPPLVATNAREGLQIAGRERPSLVLMDIGLPGDMDGIEAAASLRSRLAIPSIFITGSSDPHTIGRARVAEPLGYLVKPFDKMALQAAVETGLERARLERLIMERGQELEALSQELGQRQIDLEKQNQALKQAQGLIKENEERYRQIFETNQAVKLIVDPSDGAIVDANQAACDFYGYSRAELTSKKTSEINAAPSEVVRRAMEAAVRQEELVFSFQHRLASGELRDVEVHTGPMTWQGRTLLHSIIHDVTVRRRAEENLRHSEEILRSLVSTNPESLLLTDPQGIVLAINQTAASRLGRPVDEIVGRDLFGFLPQEVADSRRQHVQEVLQSGQPVHFVDQRWGRHMENYVYPISDQDGQVHRLAIYGVDITDLVQALERLSASRESLEQRIKERTRELEAANRDLQREVAQRQAVQEALADSEKRWQRAVQWAPLPMMIHAEDGEVLLLNDAWRELTGYTLADIPTIGRWVALAYSPGQAWIKRAIKKLYHLDRRMDAGEFQVRAKDGRMFTWHFSGAPLGIGADGRRLAISIAMDVSERKLAEEKIASLARFPSENPNPVLRFTPAGDLLYANQPASRLLQLLWSDQDGHEEQSRSLRGAASWALATGALQTTEVLTGDHIFSLSFVPVAEAGYVNIYGMDITERKQVEESMRVLAKFPDENPNPVLRVSSQGTVTYANPACRTSLGDQNCQEGQPAPAILAPGLAYSAEPQSNREFEVHLKGRAYLFTSTPVSDTGEIYFYGQDVTERKQLEHQRQMASTVFENSLEGIIIADPEGKVQMVNAAYSDITGFQAWEIIGQDLDVFRSEGHDPKFLEEIWARLAEQGRWSGEYWNRRKNGEAYPEWLNVVLVRDSQGRIANYVVIFHDITDIKSQEERIKHQAFHDALTGLPNRVLFKDRLGQAIAHADREAERLAVVFLDLDNFKRVNDSLGHQAGDLLLQETARRLKGCLREIDTVSRLGGDEFTMILREVGRPEDALEAAGRILKALAEPFLIHGQELFVTTSMGITFFPDDARDSESLLKNADMAMYRAKDQGRNNFQIFTPALNAEIQHRLRLESQMRQGLEGEEFIAHYQPKVEVATGRVVGMEALVRWQRPGQGLLMPGAFITLAEDAGLILPIGERVLRLACREAQAWRQAGHPYLCVSVNLSPRQFEQDNLVEMVEEILHETGLPSVYLELEITEGAMIKSVDKAISKLVGLASMGVRLALDDFGTGYSSLSYLKRFSLSALKIDQSFVRDLTHDANDAAIVQTIIAMGHALELQVVAEGVETSEQLDFLRANGCDDYQGYYFSRPLPPADFLALLSGSPASGGH